MTETNRLVVDSLDYREVHIDFYEDPLGDQFVAT